MDQKQIKNSLKDAKEALKSKNIERALKLCKAVLKADDKNYLGWVMFGAVLQESNAGDQVPYAYRKATQISSDQILAWQGLASYYEKEKNNDVCDELSLVYKQLLLLEKDPTKKENVWKKLIDIIKHVTKKEIVEELSTLLETEDVEITSSIQSLLLECFRDIQDVPVLCLPMYKCVLLREIAKCEESDKHRIFQIYLQVLYKLKEYVTIIESGGFLSDTDIINEKSLEILCYAFCEVSTSQFQKCREFEIEKYFNRLLSLNENSVNGLLSKAIHLYYSKDYISSRDLFLHVIDLGKKNWIPYYYLSRLFFKLFCFSDALNFISQTRAFLPSNNDFVAESLEVYYLQAASNCSDLNECQKCYNRCQEILLSRPDDELTLKCSVQSAVRLSRLDFVDENLLKLQVHYPKSFVLMKAFLLSETNRSEEAITFLKNSIQEDSLYIEHWMLLGKLYWSLERWDDARNTFLRAAKLAPHNYSTFFYLGNYYANVGRDYDKARRCYEKSYQLNPKNEETGIALCEIYRILNLPEKTSELLINAVNTDSRKWASFRLGQHYLEQGNAEASVRYLRQCVRTDSNNSYYWEVLGDACATSGSYNAALKCYEKCSSLAPTSIYPRLQAAVVKQKIGLFDGSLDDVRAIVKENPTFFPGLMSLSEICYARAKEQFENQILSSVRNLCEEAALSLWQALMQKNRLICIWKMLADSCVLVCQLPVSLSFLKLPQFLFKEKERNMDDLCEYQRDELLEFAIRCYQTIIYLNKGEEQFSSSMWHDIAFCYNLRANWTDGSVRTQQRQLALAAAKTSVSKNPKAWEHWNLLGVIAASDEIRNVALAQHCFINAIKLDDQNAQIWNNLGTLFFKFNDIAMANEAFRAAQRIDPKYSRPWIGQALIAESVNHDETADLFYHSTTLGYHHESAKGFAEWICKILIDWNTYKNSEYCRYLIEHMYGLQKATVVQTWYTAHHPEDVAGTNTMAVLFELCKLHRSAVSSSKISLKFMNEEQSDIVYFNLGRQLRKLRSYIEAIEVLQRVKNVDFNTQCELALSLCLGREYEKSLLNYEEALHKCSQSEDYKGYKGEIMVAMAAVNYLLNRKQTAQTFLLECTRLNPSPIHGLFAACAFGMLTKQLILSKLVLKELRGRKNDLEYSHHVAMFSAYCEVFQQNFKSAISTMSKFIFERPGDARIWLSLAHLLLNLIFMAPGEYKTYSFAAAYHAKCAITLGKNTIDISKIYSTVSLSYLFANKIEDCLRSSSKAVFLYPNEAENWAVLIAARYTLGDNYSSLLNTIKFVREKLTCSKDLLAWLSKVEKKVITIIG